MADAVAGDLVAVAVDVLDVAVVRPLVTHVESGRYWTAVGVSRKYEIGLKLYNKSMSNLLMG